MAIKRGAPPSGAERSLKQSKLHFGPKLATAPPQPALQQATKQDGTAESSGMAPSEVSDSKATEVSSSLDAVPDSKTTFKRTESEAPSNPSTFIITERVGDIFDAPDRAVIIHACNCIGSWGAGIAAAFQKRYPKAFQTYKRHCENKTPDALVGTALLIRPMETDGKDHYVGCLFTSRRFGRRRDSPAEILKQTAPAMEDLMRQMEEEGNAISEIRMCQINSGLFSVPWVKTKAIIENMEVEHKSTPNEIIVYSLPSK